MIWSVSGDKQFKRCPRQWYFSNIVADARVKNDPFRKEVTILSKLQSIEAWRGSLVDDTISRSLVYALNNKLPVRKEYFIDEALKNFDRQLEYGVFQQYRMPGSRMTTDKDFAAFMACDLGEELKTNELDQARKDIVEALTNFFDDLPFIDYLRSGSLLASQRTLIYPFDRFNIRAIPDLIVFFNDRPPHIFDWKVHTYGNISYDEQLIAYAAALYSVAKKKPHVDFPANIGKYSIYDYQLTEYQLLHKDRIRRDYEVTEETLEELSDRISNGIIEMYMTGCHKKYGQVTARKFPTTKFFENCPKCPFKKICNIHEHETGIGYFPN